MKIDLEKIAKELGVSKTLVSLVLNNKAAKYGISEKTQKSVLKKAKELNYKPNLIARSLRTGKSNIIGLVVADISNPFYSKIARSIENSASQVGYHLIICSSEEKASKERELIDLLIKGQTAEGLIISSTQNEAQFFHELQKSGKPFVLIDRLIPKVNCDTVTVDNYKGAFELTEHLIKCGHKRIAMLTISPNFISSIADRVKGYKEALKKHKIKFDASLLREIPFNNVAGKVDKELKDLTSGKKPIEALFVANNNLAVSCLDTLNHLGLKVPDDVALACFDDLEMFKFSSPEITAVAQPLQEIGDKAFQLLYTQMKAGKPDKKSEAIILPTKLQIRKSTKKV